MGYLFNYHFLKMHGGGVLLFEEACSVKVYTKIFMVFIINNGNVSKIKKPIG